VTDKRKPATEESPADYEVGYGKPPRHTRFQSGRSGNPRGRPRGTKNLKTDLQEELREKVVVREGERPKTVSKQRAFVKMLMAKSLKGDVRSANTVLSMMWRLMDTGAGAPEFEEPLIDEELDIVKTFEERARREGHDEAPDDPDDDKETPS
jgi:hypothetical protein